MEERPKEKTRALQHNNIVDAIKERAAIAARAPLDSEERLLLFLQSWWSRTYNKPLKDPILQSYTIEELLYEFFDRIERQKASDEALEQENVRIEEEKDQANLDWAERMEREEMEAEMRSQSNKLTDPSNTANDNAESAWMEQQIMSGKEQFGESFGEDIVEVFDEE
jgi:hypothetical protein